MRRLPSEQGQQALVDRFNQEFPVGAKVYLRKDSATIETVVRAEARVVPGPTAVAFFEEVSGYYSIENRVTKREE